MTIQEAIKEIKSRHKPYTYANPVMTQQSYSKMMQRIEKGKAKDTAIFNFLDRFGYKLEINLCLKPIE